MKLNYNEMMDLCKQKPELRAKVEMVDGIEVTIFSYMVTMRDTFDSELAKEFRGTVFRNDTEECICRPFQKFFNLGEVPETQPEKINWRNAQFFIKHDGSMATPVLLNNKIFWKTKNSFYSDVAMKIQKFWEESLHEGDSFFSSRKALIHALKRCHYTPIFEYVAPHNRIVLEYEKEELKYLGFRSIETGEFWPYTGTYTTVTQDQVFDMEGIEGFVVHDGNKMFKMKTKWYLDRHKICTEFNPKKIIECTLNETIDDMIATIYQLNLPERAKKVERLRDEVNKIKLSCNSIIQLAWNLVKVYKDDRKVFAEEVNKHLRPEFRGFMFALLDGKDINKMLNKLVFETTYSHYKETENVQNNH